MSSEKYIGLDVHQATISVAVRDSQGNIIMESILETKASTILDFFAGLRGTLSVTFEEGTSAAWLYDLLKPHVAKVLVCNPRKNAALKQGNKNDKMDAGKLSERLRLNDLSSVYHGENGLGMLRELARSYLTIVKDLTRVMSRVKALYRSWAIPCAGRDVYYTRHRNEWLDKIQEPGVRLSSRATLSAVGHVATPASASPARAVGGESQTCHHGQATTDSVAGADSLCLSGGADSDSASFPHQAPAVDLQRTGVRDSRQRRVSVRPRPSAATQEAGVRSWLK